MTDDLVARLRDAHQTSRQRIVGSNIFAEAADEIEAMRAFRERDKAEIKSLRETVETLMRGSRTEELVEEANALRDDLRQATTKLGAAEARVRELEAERDEALREKRRLHDMLDQAGSDLLYQITRTEGAERALAEAYERAASKCEELQKAFATDEYALNQPQSSFGERYACGRCAEGIRKLAQEVKHEAE